MVCETRVVSHGSVALCWVDGAYCELSGCEACMPGGIWDEASVERGPARQIQIRHLGLEGCALSKLHTEYSVLTW